MMFKYRHTLILGLLMPVLFGCAELTGPSSESKKLGIDEDRFEAIRIASTNPPDLRAGDQFEFDNPLTIWQVEAVDASGKITWGADNGEVQMTAANLLLPALEWKSASRGNGRRVISNISRPMFPLTSGQDMQFLSTVETDQPPYAWEFDWSCHTGDIEMITVPAGSFPSYRIACGRQQPEELVFHYAPEVGNYVRLEVINANGGEPIVRKLISFKRGPRSRPVRADTIATNEETKIEHSELTPLQPTAPETKKMMPKTDLAAAPTVLGAASDADGKSVGGQAQDEAIPLKGKPLKDMINIDDTILAVHLASYKNPGNVEIGWKQLAAAHLDQLSDLRPLVRKVNLERKGLFHRLHAGPLPNRTFAKFICKTLKQRGVYCAVVNLK